MNRFYVNIPLSMLRERLEDVIKYKINPEVYLDGGDLSGMDDNSMRELGETLRGNGAALSVHGPYVGLSPGDGSEEKRGYTVGRFRRAIEGAALLGAPSIVLHGGIDERRGFHNLAQYDTWFSASLKTWREVVDYAQSLGVTVHLENVYEATPGPLKELLEDIDSSAFQVCLDPGHVNAFSTREQEDWFKVLGPHIRELHIHDNLGVEDDHLVIGEGNMDFEEIFGLINRYTQSPIITIEPHGEEAFWRFLKVIPEYVAMME